MLHGQDPATPARNQAGSLCSRYGARNVEAAADPRRRGRGARSQPGTSSGFGAAEGLKPQVDARQARAEGEHDVGAAADAVQLGPRAPEPDRELREACGDQDRAPEPMEQLATGVRRELPACTTTPRALRSVETDASPHRELDAYVKLDACGLTVSLVEWFKLPRCDGRNDDFIDARITAKRQNGLDAAHTPVGRDTKSDARAPGPPVFTRPGRVFEGGG
jgi:hypothetical protein